MALRFTHPLWELVYWKSLFPCIMFSLLLSFHLPGNYMLSIITLGSSLGENPIKIDVNQKLTPSPFLLLPKAPLLSLWRFIKRVWWGGTDFYSCASKGVCWRRLLRVPWTARRSNQSILKEISPGCSLEGLMLKLKLNTLATWCEELTHWKRPWCWERLKAGGEGDDRGWDGWMASPNQWTWVWVNSGSWWWTGRPGVLQFMESQRVGHDWGTELTWTEQEEEGLYSECGRSVSKTVKPQRTQTCQTGRGTDLSCHKESLLLMLLFHIHLSPPQWVLFESCKIRSHNNTEICKVHNKLIIDASLKGEVLQLLCASESPEGLSEHRLNYKSHP